MRLGNGRWEHTSFNTRLQPIEIGLGGSATDSSLLKLNYDYGTTANNGNVLRQIITVPTIGADTGFTATQHYQYDQLNRLTGAQEVNGVSTAWQSTIPSPPFWQQMFSYDRFGNRAVVTANTTATMIGPNPVISTTTNRITPRPGEYYFYDDAGNMTKGQGGETLDYDAKNKFVQYQGGAAQSGGANYSYDGDGRRVKKATPAETLIFVYNIGGQLVAEYTTSTPEQNGTSYLTSNTLGTPRVTTKADGSVRARHDYLPFGEELYASAGSRTTGQKYDDSASPVDKTRQKFTQKERDNETTLDYFGARYYSSTTGRFTSPDPIYVSFGKINSPQTWNLYAYVGNNPHAYTDPTGMERIQLGQHNDGQIKDSLKEIERKKAEIDKDPSKSKEQKRSEKEQLNANANTLKLERQGNHMVEAMLKALPADERGTLQVSNFVLTTDTENNLNGWQALQSDVGDPSKVAAMARTAAGKNMFVLMDTAFNQTVFINTQRPNVQAAMSGQPDFIAFGATSIRHEDFHRGPNGVVSEASAFTRQREVLDKMLNAFSNREVYNRFREYLNSEIKANGGKP